MKNRAGIRGLFKGWGRGRAGNLPGDRSPAGLKPACNFGRGASPLKKKDLLRKTKFDKHIPDCNFTENNLLDTLVF